MIITYPNDLGLSHDEKVLHASSYLYSKVSQLLSWGANSYSAAFKFSDGSDGEKVSENFLPAYIQYGVSDPASAVACQLGVPRTFAKGISQQFLNDNGNIQGNNANKMINYIRDVDSLDFKMIKDASGLNGLSTKLVEKAYKKYLGL